MRARSAGWLAVSWAAFMPSMTVMTPMRDWLGEGPSTGLLFRCDMLIWISNFFICGWATGILVVAYRLKVLIDFERAKIAWAKQQQQLIQQKTPKETPKSSNCHRGISSTSHLDKSSHQTETTTSIDKYSKESIPNHEQHIPIMDPSIPRSTDMTSFHGPTSSLRRTSSTTISPATATAHAQVSLLASSLSRGHLIRYALFICIPCLIVVPIFNATINKNYQYGYGCGWQHMAWLPFVWCVFWCISCAIYLIIRLFKARANDAHGITMYLIGVVCYSIPIAIILFAIGNKYPTIGHDEWNPYWLAVVLTYIWAIHGCVWPCYISLKQRNARQLAQERLRQKHQHILSPDTTQRITIKQSRVAPYDVPTPTAQHRRSISSHPLDTCLQDKDGYDSLLKYAESAFAAENVLFWSAVHAYRQHPSIQHAQQVYDTYIDPTSELQVNLSGGVYRSCTQQYQQAQTSNQGLETLFDEALDEVCDMMRMDTWPKYIRSNYGRTYVS